MTKPRAFCTGPMGLSTSVWGATLRQPPRANCTIADFERSPLYSLTCPSAMLQGVAVGGAGWGGGARVHSLEHGGISTNIEATGKPALLGSIDLEQHHFACK